MDPAVMGALGKLPSKLLELLNEEYKLQKGVKAQIQSLSQELESTYVAISKVAQVPPDQLDLQVELWAGEVREASYDMEDILDTFLVRVDGGGGPQPADPDRVKRLMKKMGKLFDLSKVKARHGVARAIEAIDKKLKEIAERRARYRVDDLVRNPAAVASDDPRICFLYKELSQLVGIDEPRDEVMEMLSLGEDEMPNMQMKIVTIVGFGGLGKTTLAKAVYDKAIPRFDCRAFVPVGRDPNKRKVLKDILIDLINNEAQGKKQPIDEQLIGRDNKKMYNSSGFDLAEFDEKQLIDELHRFLDKKRYFIVIDDIWDTSTWEIVSNAFVDNSHGSRIIATTRNSQVSTEIGGQVYRIKELSDSNSRKLFYTRIFGSEAEKRPTNDELDEISSNIIRKCDGVPLAIIAIASLLVTKPIEDWYSVYNSIGVGHGDNRQVKNMMKILSFSYYDLPCHLRTCLLYLSVSIDDYIFERNDLIWRWIAEGLVHEEKGKVLFEVGVSYFHELLNRSMILPVEQKDQGLILFCRVHDMVLHLIRDLSSKQNFAAVLDGEQLPLAKIHARRLAFHKLAGKQRHQQLNDMDVQKVRSFSAIICMGSMIPPVSCFKVLRVLALIYCHSMESHHLENIGKLYHLRYLGLSHTPVRELPAEVGRLRFLQTLLLDDTGIKELPVSMRRLSQLMCLRADEMTRAPDWIGELTSLIELEIYPGADDTSFVKQLGKLSDLMVLKTRIIVRDAGQGRDLLESLSNLQKIQVMDIGRADKDFVEDVVLQPSFLLSCNLRVLNLKSTKLVFPTLPAWINYSLLPNLCCLIVYLSDVGEQDLEILGRFPELRALSIFTPAEHVITKPVIGAGGGFQSLRFLFTNFQLHFLQGAMPRVETIYSIVSVHSVKDNKLGQDIGLENLSSLEDIRVIINCALARVTEADEVEAAVRHAADSLPNRPTLLVVRAAKDEMVMGPEDSPRMMTRQQYRRKCALAQRRYWVNRFQALCSAVNEVSQTIHIEHPSFGQLALLFQQLRRTDERAHQEFSLSTAFAAEPELHQVIEDTAALERGFRIIRAKYPRLVAMLEELKAELNQQAEEDDTAVRHAADIHPHNSSLERIRSSESKMIQLRIKEERVKLRYRAQTKLLAALHWEIDKRTQMIHKSDPIYVKIKKIIDHLNDAVQRANHELSLWNEDSDEEDHGLHQVIEDTAALERALEIYTVEYPRLVAMLEELKAEIDQHAVLSREVKQISDCIPDGHPFVAKMNQFIVEFNNTMEWVISQQGNGVSKEADELPEIYTIAYRRLSAMLEELKAELKLQQVCDGEDKISENIPEELEEEPRFSNLSID